MGTFGYRDLPPEEGGPVGRAWWEANAADYLSEHGAFLGDAELRWGPEGLTEAEAGLLGDVAGTRLLEVGAEVARVLRPGGRWVFSVTHPLRWAFSDDPTREGLTVRRSYFDRRPYVETDE